MLMKLEDARIAGLGLGYAGLPLAVAFRGKHPTVGFDINQSRIDELRRGKDRTLDVDPEELAASGGLQLSSDPADLADCNVYVITVPTPIDADKRLDLATLLSASEMLGGVLKRGDLVI